MAAQEANMTDTAALSVAEKDTHAMLQRLNGGKAKPGDKTVLDALHPLVGSLKASAAAGDDVATAVAAAAVAARRGAESTAVMIATIGRASRLGERSRGWADPGATSFAIIVEALASAFVRELSQK